MAILNLTLYPDDPLIRVAEPIADFGPNLAKLAADMLETMHAHEGVGLAGPQVGLAQRLFVLDEPDAGPMCLVNPEIADLDGREVGEEGCLSLPRVYAMVPRATRLRVKAYDPLGKPLDFDARGFLARIIQHELDHLNGVVFLDRVDILTRQAKLQEWEEARAQLLAPLTSTKRARC